MYYKHVLPRMKSFSGKLYFIFIKTYNWYIFFSLILKGQVFKISFYSENIYWAAVLHIPTSLFCFPSNTLKTLILVF